MTILLIKTHIDIDITNIIYKLSVHFLKERAIRNLFRFSATEGPVSHRGWASVLFLELLIQEYCGPSWQLCWMSHPYSHSGLSILGSPPLCSAIVDVIRLHLSGTSRFHSN